MTAIVVVAIVSIFLFGVLGAWVSSQKGRNPVEGLVLGALFSAIGVLIAALLPTDTVGLAASRAEAQTLLAESRTPPQSWSAPSGLRCNLPTEPKGKRCPNPVTHAVFVRESDVPYVLRCDEHIEEEQRALEALYATVIVRPVR